MVVRRTTSDKRSSVIMVPLGSVHQHGLDSDARTRVVHGLGNVRQCIDADHRLKREEPLVIEAQNARHEYGWCLMADDAAGHGASFQKRKCVGTQFGTF